MRFYSALAIGATIILCAFAAYKHFHELALWGRSDADIRSSILTITPLGSSYEEVIQRIKTRIHPNTLYQFKHGLALPAKGTDSEGKIMWSQWPLGGEHHDKIIGCQIGSSSLTAVVVANWAFDDEDRLEDVFVAKDANLP
jgi:hypothetical protein